MLLRLVSPVRRPGSSNVQFVKRLPEDIRERLVGMRVAVPVGGEIRPITIPKSGIRLSLGTSDPGEAKARQGEVAAYFESLFRSVREDRPVVLTRRHAVALSRALYDAWVAGEGRERDVAVMVYADPSSSRGARVEHEHDALESEEEAEAFRATAARIAAAGDNAEELEAVLGPLVERLLLGVGIASLAPPLAR